MPYILVNPLPPPRRNPYHPDLRAFTTSSRAIVRFFHSHGWRARHVYAAFPPSTSSAAPSLTSTRSSCPCSVRSTGSIGSNDYISASSLSSHFPGPEPEHEHEHEQPPCCLTSSDSSLLSCGPVLELHCYLIPLNPAIFHGPQATALQVRYLRWYAHPHICFDSDGGGGVDLRLPNQEALALQRERDEEFWRGERKAERRRRRRERGEGWDDVRVSRGEGAEGNGDGSVVLGSLVRFGERGGDEEMQLVSADQDGEIDEELGGQWEMFERALLASEGLEWAEDGETLRKTRDV